MDIAYDQKLSGRESDVEQKSSSINGLMQWNNLVYTMPITNSVATSRNVKFYPASADLYDSQNNTKMVFTVQTGSQFVDFSKSYLKFDMATEDGSHDVTTGSNPFESICNIIDSVVVTSRQGVELLRIKDFARWRVIQNALNLSETKYNTIKQVIFSGGADTDKTVVDKDNVSNCVIPMWLLGGFFESTQLLPPALCAGMRIEITLLGIKKAFKYAGGKSNYLILHPTLCLDTTLLNDAATRQVRANAAANGLEITYRDVYFQSTGTSSSHFEVPVTKAVSRALVAYAVPWGEYATDGAGENFTAGTKKVTKYQWRLGSSYYPQREILDNAREQYINSLYSFEYDQTGVTSSTLTYRDFPKFAIMTATLERSALLKFSGRSINNSTTLQLSANTNGDTTLTIYLEHVKIAKVFNTNVVVSL